MILPDKGLQCHQSCTVRSEGPLRFPNPRMGARPAPLMPPPFSPLPARLSPPGPGFPLRSPASPLRPPEENHNMLFPSAFSLPASIRQRLALFAFFSCFFFPSFSLRPSRGFRCLKNYNNNRGEEGGRGIDIKHGSQKRVAKSLP